MKWKSEIKKAIEEDMYDYYNDYCADDEWLTKEEWESYKEEMKVTYSYEKGSFRKIDMNSIYDKKTFRKKQIERLLGIDEKMSIPRFKDIWK